MEKKIRKKFMLILCFMFHVMFLEQQQISGSRMYFVIFSSIPFWCTNRFLSGLDLDVKYRYIWVISCRVQVLSLICIYYTCCKPIFLSIYVNHTWDMSFNSFLPNFFFFCSCVSNFWFIYINLEVFFYCGLDIKRLL